MRKIDVNKVIEDGKINNYFLTIFGLLLLVVLFDGYDMGVYGVTLPSIMKELGLTATQTGLLASVGMFGMMFGALLFGSLADIIGRKKVIIITTEWNATSRSVNDSPSTNTKTNGIPSR